MHCSRAILTLAVVLALIAAQASGDAATPAERLQQARDELVEAAQEYRASLERLLPFRDDAVAHAREELEARRRHVEGGLIARRDLDAAEQALAAAEAAAAKTREELVHVDLVIAETQAAALLPPAAPGTVAAVGPLIRFQGHRPWSLDAADTLGRFFSERFGRALPVSALGQTAVHDRLGFDHRNALDISVHPDSAEGRALMEWLRARGVSFLAFRGAVAGESTGAHLHVGEPSPRRVTGQRS